MLKEVGSIVSLFIFLGFAVWQDYHTQRISNLLIFIAFISAVLYRFLQNGFQSVFVLFFHAGSIMLILFPLYFIKALGAGDVKLLGVAAAYLSWQTALQAFLAGIYISLIPVSISFLYKRKNFKRKIAMSGPIAGGILFVLYKEGCI